MLLILTNSEDVTASFLVPYLEGAGIAFLRLDTDSLLSKAAFRYSVGKPALRVAESWIEPADVSNIWYRRPDALKGPNFDGSPEGKYAQAEWGEFLECFFAHVSSDRWMNYPPANFAASRKLEQLTTAVQLGFLVPDTLVTQDPKALLDFYDKHDGQIIVKPISSGYVERPAEQRDSLIYTNRVLPEHLKDLTDLASCPSFFQQCIAKQTDVRITVVDSQILSVALYASDAGGAQRCDIRRNNMSDVRYEIIDLPAKVDRSIRKLMKHYSLRFGAIDMAITERGDWYFFEINPNGQWAWLDQCANTKIWEAFVKSFSRKVPSLKEA